MGLSSYLPISAHVAPCWCTRNYFFSLMHPIGPELPISAHVSCACVCRQLYVLRISQALVQATVGVGTVIIVYIGVAYTRGGGYISHIRCGQHPLNCVKHASGRTAEGQKQHVRSEGQLPPSHINNSIPQWLGTGNVPT